MRTRLGICRRKRRFASRAAADAAALKARVSLRAYACALCRGFHLTSRTQGLWAPRAARGEGAAG